MNFSEIIEELINQEISPRDLALCDFGDFTNDNIRVLPNLGRIEEIGTRGGEGDGSEWYSIKHFMDWDIYVKITGWYSSYDGTEFNSEYSDCCKQVYPKQKTVTVFEYNA